LAKQEETPWQSFVWHEEEEEEEEEQEDWPHTQGST
jgi:hypothetical protein